MQFLKISDSFPFDYDRNPLLVQENASLAKTIRELIQYFAALGVRINPVSRLHQYANLLERDHDPLKTTLDEALLEAFQFVTIARAFQESTVSPNWLPSLASATGGHVDSRKDQGGSRSRSNQFELYTMASLAGAGFQAEPSEPDLWTQISGTEVAFAAKRLRSWDKLARNLSDGADQIERHGVPGYIVLDISFINQSPKPLFVRSPNQQLLPSVIIADGFVELHHKTFLAYALKPHILGILVHASVAARTLTPLARFVSRRWVLFAARDTQISRTLITAIQNKGKEPWTPIKLRVG